MNEIRSKLKSLITNKFKVSGFFIKSDCVEYLAELLEPVEEDDRGRWLRDILGHIQSQGIETLNINRKTLDLAIKACTNQGFMEDEPIFSVINAFEVPKFRFNDDQKKFVIVTDHKTTLPKSDMKGQYMCDRYTIAYHRTSRHPLFAGSVLNAPTFALKKVEQLVSSTRLKEIVVLGLLTQLSDGKFFIEDPTGVIPIDLSQASLHSGLFCEGCFVLAEGTFTDGTLKVTGLGFPPPESASSSRAFFAAANTFGGPSKTLLKYSKKLEDFEKRNDADGIIFIADCWLDVPEVMDKIKVLFDGFDEFPPIAIVMMGPFMKTYDDLYSLKKHLNALGELINATTRLKNETYIVLVPATEDPISVNVFPRHPLPEALTSELKRNCPKVIMATNPCRIQYCTQQIVVCRIDLVTKMCRNAIKFPTSGTLDDHFTRTLVSQATLAPLHPINLPIFWDYDAAMLLYPLPDVVVIGDPSNAFHARHHECTVINTGSFPKSKYAFKMYNASQKTVEDSQLPDDQE